MTLIQEDLSELIWVLILYLKLQELHILMQLSRMAMVSMVMVMTMLYSRLKM